MTVLFRLVKADYEKIISIKGLLSVLGADRGFGRGGKEKVFRGIPSCRLALLFRRTAFARDNFLDECFFLRQLCAQILPRAFPKHDRKLLLQ